MAGPVLGQRVIITARLQQRRVSFLDAAQSLDSRRTRIKDSWVFVLWDWMPPRA